MHAVSYHFFKLTFKVFEFYITYFKMCIVSNLMLKVFSGFRKTKYMENFDGVIN